MVLYDRPRKALPEAKKGKRVADWMMKMSVWHRCAGDLEDTF